MRRLRVPMRPGSFNGVSVFWHVSLWCKIYVNDCLDIYAFMVVVSGSVCFHMMEDVKII